MDIKKLISLTAALLIVVPTFGKYGEGEKEILAMFWNLENFFDWKDSGYSEADREFSMAGERKWSREKFYAKCNAVAKSILWIGSRYGRMPDIIGFAEVENIFVLRSLTGTDALKKYGYGIIHHESNDRRGIDVAVIYRKDIIECDSSIAFNVYKTAMRSGFTGCRKFETRDILQVSSRSIATGERYEFIVNHHPSKYGGEKESHDKRVAAVAALGHICDSIYKAGSKNIAVMGDFNETPDSEIFLSLRKSLQNMVPKSDSGVRGTIRYKGKWESIDHFWVSETLAGKSESEICPIPFLMTGKKNSPSKPVRTYTGPVYSGGVSDHIPIILRIKSE